MNDSIQTTTESTDEGTPTESPTSEFATFKQGRVLITRYKGTNPRRAPILVIAGGPGFPHDYLEPLAVLSQQGHDVVFFDYLGCGGSDTEREVGHTNMETFVEELSAVILKAQLDTPIVVAHSFGTAVASEYLSRSNKAKALILISPFPSARSFVEAKRQIISTLPEKERDAALEFSGEGKPTFDYQMAFARFNAQAVLRIPMPDCLRRSHAGFNQRIHNTMWGNSPFQLGGLMKDWCIEDRLGEIKVPCLIISGRHDECNPEIVAKIHEGLPTSSWIVLENSSHMSHLEEPDEFNRHVAEFLQNL